MLAQRVEAQLIHPSHRAAHVPDLFHYPISLHIPRPGGQGDRARGISAERFEIPLAGGAAAAMPAGVVGRRAACAAWGEPARPGFSPEGKRERGESSSLLPQADSALRPLSPRSSPLRGSVLSLVQLLSSFGIRSGHRI
jgi:hypothetical protein